MAKGQSTRICLRFGAAGTRPMRVSFAHMLKMKSFSRQEFDNVLACMDRLIHPLGPIKISWNRTTRLKRLTSIGYVVLDLSARGSGS